MTASVDESKPVETPDTTDITDLDNVEALLEQADALATEAVQAVEASTPVNLDESLAVAAVDAAAGSPPAESQQQEQSAGREGGVGGTLDDLDNLLQELGEQPAPADAEPDAPVAGPAAGAQGGANPYAGEVAQLEQRWSAEAAKPQKNAREKTTEPEADTAALEYQGEEFTGGIVRAILGRVASVLAIFDIPFARLGPRVKNVIGYAAWATLAVAIAVWLAGPLVAEHLVRQPAATKTSSHSSPVAASGGHEPTPAPKPH